MTLRVGDIIFLKPKDLIFELIKKCLNRQFLHVGIVTNVEYGHVSVTEALPRGVDVNDFIWNEKKKEDYVVYRNVMASPQMIKRIASAAVQYHGTPYEKGIVINALIRCSWCGTARAVCCSELIYRILRGLRQIKDAFNPEWILPTDLQNLMIADVRYRKVGSKVYQ